MKELSNGLALKESGSLPGSEGIEFVKDVVEEIICKSFSTEFEQAKKVSHAIGRERYVRETLKFSGKGFREKSEEFQEKINNDLSIFKRPDIDKWISGIVDDEFVHMCDEEPDKKFINLIIAKLIWDRSRKNHLTKVYKIYRKDWYKEPYRLEFNWECSHCKNQNFITYAKRTSPNSAIEEFKCPSCGITISSVHKTRFDWEKPISGKEILKKTQMVREELKNYRWPSENPVRFYEWAEQEQYIAFHRNKHKLPHEVRKFLDYFSRMPKSEERNSDYSLALDECGVRQNLLEKFGLIKKISLNTPIVEIVEKFLDEFQLLTSRGWIKPFHDNVSPEMNCYIENQWYLNYPRLEPVIFFNKFFFEESLSFKDYALIKDKQRFMKNVFNSNAEKRCFHSLKRTISQNQTVLPNYPVDYVFDFSEESIKKEFDNDELLYLQRAIFDFVIIDESGTPTKILELQLGPHHKKPKYNRRDLLKKKLCEICGIQFQEIF